MGTSQLAAAGAVERPPADPPEDTAGQSAFSPFASLGTVVQQPAPAAPESQGGDLAVPVVATGVGLAVIASLLWKLVQ